MSSIIKAHKTKIRLHFLKRCLEEQVIPKTFLPKRFQKYMDGPFCEFQKIFLRKHIDITALEVKATFRDLMKKRTHFERSIPPLWKTTLANYVYSELRLARCNLQHHLYKKLETLIQASPWTTNSEPSFYMNLSDKLLDSNEKTALGYGLSFAYKKNNFNYVSCIKSFNNLEKYGDVSVENINICKGIICNPFISGIVKSKYINLRIVNHHSCYILVLIMNLEFILTQFKI